MTGTSTDEKEEIHRLLVLDKKLPAPPYDFETITKLDFFDCGLSTLPKALPTALPNLSILFCMKNDFQEVPAIIGECSQLQMISFKSNHNGPLTSIHPDALQPQLRWLILTDNEISKIPSTIGRCTKLQKCMLSGNALRSLPDEISKCKNLELIRLASNQLDEPPVKLLELPKLAWVAFSNNPFLSKDVSSIDEVRLGLKTLDDPSLEDPTAGKELGKGASGVTHRHVLNGQPVAVKTYVGEMTSDGDPAEERNISCRASTLDCPALIQVLGQTPRKGALVMEYLENYVALGNPPSLDSCSRDVYPEDLRLSPSLALAYVSALVDAVSKLHAVGICHGDFYGHNILIPGPITSLPSPVDATTRGVKLSDFGAAFMYDTEASYGRLVQRCEQRALGIFTEEVAGLLSRKGSPSEAEPLRAVTRDKLLAFAKTCHGHSTVAAPMADMKERWRKFSEDS